MCIFTKTVESVSNTRIFARTISTKDQVLVYQMKYRAGEELAMILPLPVPPSPKEDAVKFVDMYEDSDFFEKLDGHFRREPSPRKMQLSRSSDDTLKVHEVGDYEASFVPRLNDFHRLDERFRLPGKTWDKLPQYFDWGFAVFQLRGGKSKMQMPRPADKVGAVADRQSHPMAFFFPRRPGHGLFFPTVHIHDGEVHPIEHFDHTLYLQSDPSIDHIMDKATDWEMSSTDFSVEESPLLANRKGYKIRLEGEMTNQDVVIG
jgi:hypothetical protein